MADPRVPDAPAPHDQKRTLIETALETLQTARALDERESLQIEKWTAWYDATIPLVTDIKVIATAIESECYVRRGERIASEPAEPGRRTDLSHGVRGVAQSGTLSRVEKVEKSERSRLRAVGKNASAARDYVKAEAKAGRVPTKAGMLRHVKLVAKSRPVSPKPSSPKQDTTARDTDARTLAALVKLADGVRRTDREIEKVSGIRASDYMRSVRLIPWLTLDRTSVGTVFAINRDLRDLCAGLGSRPDLPGGSVLAFYTHIRAEITRRRKEANDLFKAANWVQGEIHTKRQSELLDWIEEQLNRIP